jgi:hypothetical protein|tara:strand:+ start:545 stop:799 length:255 start_codon:yes stop_codon:yes gene_type:complete
MQVVPDKDPGTDWLERALCAAEGDAPEFVWSEEPTEAETQQALAVCRSCDVKVECLADTPTELEGYDDVFEIRGGLALWLVGGR